MPQHMCVNAMEQRCEVCIKGSGTCACKTEPRCSRRSSDGDQVQQYVRARTIANLLDAVSSVDAAHWSRSHLRSQSFRIKNAGKPVDACEEHAAQDFDTFERRVSSSGVTTLPEWPLEDSAVMERGRRIINTLHMDPTLFSSDDLCLLLLEVFKEAGLPQELPSDLGCVKRLILSVREHMYDNPYHNFFHVFDVMQTTYVIASRIGTLSRLTAWECFALLAAALCHDLEHPGVDSPFLARADAVLGDAFRAPLLEKHHALCAFEIMADREIGVLKDISSGEYYEFRRTVFTPRA